MKGVILAGGTGSRLFPLTKVTNKHLLPVGKKPMILHPIDKLVQAGIKDIVVVTGVEHMGDVVNLLGSGKDFGVRFGYKVQDEAGGIAQALGLVQDFIHDSKFVTILGDNIFSDDLTPFVNSFENQKGGAKVILKEVKDPGRFGVAELEGNRIRGIEEKPKAPKSNFAVTGIYFYESSVFEVVRTLKPSGRGELEITDVNNCYVRQGTLTCDFFKGPWTDAGTFDSLYLANRLMFEQ
ncbi:spore coat protein [bacterium]|nr:spore coat protein [bacterium]NBW98476.1 spore coat protein [bacterium]NBX81633.1 spore coat protein [bacterium]